MTAAESAPHPIYAHRRGGTFLASLLLSLILAWMDPAWSSPPGQLQGFGIVLAIIVTLTSFVVIRRTTLWICSPGGRIRVRHVGLLGGVDADFAANQLELQVLSGMPFHALWLDLPGHRLGVTLRLGSRRRMELLARRLATNLGCRVREVP